MGHAFHEGGDVSLHVLLEGSQGIPALGARMKVENLHSVGGLIPLHLPNDGVTSIQRVPLDLRTAILHEEGAKAEMSRIDGVSMLHNQALDLTVMLRWDRAGAGGMSQEVSVLMNDAVGLHDPGERRHAEISKDDGEVLVGQLGPLSSTNDEWGGLLRFLCAPILHHLRQGCQLHRARWRGRQ